MMIAALSFFQQKGSFIAFNLMFQLQLVVNYYNQNLIKTVFDCFGLFPQSMFFGGSSFFFYNCYVAEEIFHKNIVAKNRFKNLMDNSMEGILIIKEEIIEYMNDEFM